ncbi:unnamed protein product [Urochloa humidicola]
MPGLTTMMALAWTPPSPSPANLRFSSGGKTTASAMPLVTKRSPSSAHLLRRGRALAAAAAAAEQRQQTEDLMLRLDEDGWVEEHMLSLLAPVAEAWQPADLLPTFAAAAGSDEQRTQVAELQARAAGVPDELLVCLVGNMVTEEALPTYMTMGNRTGGAANDVTGCDGHAWARWLRGWAAEENRHGDLLNRYLYLCGRVDMAQVERNVHHLIARGMRMSEPSCP